MPLESLGDTDAFLDVLFDPLVSLGKPGDQVYNVVKQCVWYDDNAFNWIAEDYITLEEEGSDSNEDIKKTVTETYCGNIDAVDGNGYVSCIGFGFCYYADGGPGSSPNLYEI